MFVTVALLAITVAAANPLELKDGERIVWIGSTVAEREQRYGSWETALLCQFPQKAITLRNLGWSGDTVFGEARASFDPIAKGYERLVSLTLELKPTLLFVSYGTNEAFDTSGHFEKQLEKLLDDLAPAKARVVLFTPRPFENAPGVKDLTAKNAKLAAAARTIRDVADRRGHRIADLLEIGLKHKGGHFTGNGMHLSEAGYEGTIPDFLGSLGLTWSAEEPRAFEAIRQAVVAKNALFFHRWRPENETYLFGFRRHEQGRNAKEIVEFDPLVTKADEAVRGLLAKLVK